MKEKIFSNRNKMLALLIGLVILFSAVTFVSFAAEGVPEANIHTSLSIVSGTGSSEMPANTVLSGDSFKVEFGYSVMPNFGSSEYQDAYIMVEIPSNVIVTEEDLLPNSDVAQSDGSYLASIVTVGGIRYVRFELISPLQPGGYKNLGFRAKFANLTTPDGETATFNAFISGNFVPDSTADPASQGYKQSFNFEPAAVTATAQAGDDWDVKKSIVAQGPADDGTDTYEVTYRIDVDFAENLDTDNTNNRTQYKYGRLEFETYQLVDTLPENYTEGGGAQLVSVSGEEGFTPTYTTTLNTDGSLKTITFTNYRKTAEADTYLTEGSSLSTAYFVTVRYPRDKYEWAYNDTVQTPWTLDNLATLNYKLISKDPQTKTSDIAIELGRREARPAAHTLSVTKRILINDTTYILTKDLVDLGYERAQFALYTDAACENLAVDLDGATFGTLTTDDTGVVTFANLRYGTYYLKEVYVPDGFSAMSPNPLQVVIGKTDAAVINLTADNSSRTKGTLELTKKAIDASGNTINLGGVDFALYKADDLETPVATGTTAANGVLTFHNLTAGEYAVKELATNQAEYEPYADFIYVTVVANQVAKPQIGELAAGVVMNSSKNGALVINKTDLTGGALSGAEFDVYGPSATEPTAEDQPIAHITVNTSYTFNSLTPGKYWIKETKAPEDYKLDPTWKTATVVKNTKTALTIQNEPLTTLIIEKWAKWGDVEKFNALDGVSFHIYTDPECTIPWTTATITTSISAGKAVASVRLPAGTYYFKEVDVVEGYKDNTATVYQVTLTPGTSKVIEVVNEPRYGRIRIVKKDSADPTKLLDNVEFEIYSDASCQTLVASVTTGTTGSGEGLSKLLPPGKYFIKEKSAPSGYYLQFTTITGVNAENVATGEISGTGISVPEETEVSVIVYNDPEVDIEITKVDSAKTSILLAGAVLGIYPTRADAVAGTNLIVQKTTNASGYTVFSGLAPNKTYWIMELTAPSGYAKMAEPLEVSCTNVDVQKTITDDRLGTLKIHKTGVFDGISANLSGAKFQLYSVVSGDADTDCVAANAYLSQFTTGSDGVGTLYDVIPGTYWLKEITAPTGYAAVAPVKVTIAAGDNVAGYDRTVVHVQDSIVNTANKGKLQIRKVEAGTDTGVKAVFKLYKKLDGGGYATTSAATLTTNSGNATSSWLEPGIYLLKETSVTGNYTLMADREITITAGETLKLTGDQKLENVPKGRIKIIKKSTLVMGSGALEMPVESAVFEVYKKVSSDFAADKLLAGAKVGTVTTGADGTVTSGYLDAGNYWITETVAPTGFTLDGTPHAITVVAKQTVEIELDNTAEWGRIRIYKRDLANHDILLNGAQFELYVRDDVNGTEYNIGGTVIKLRKATDSDIESGTETGYTGTALTEMLNPGETTAKKQYYLKELATSPLLTSYGYVMVTEWTGPIEINPGTVTEVTVYNYKPATVPGVKLDSYTGAGLPGAYVAVFESYTAAQNVPENVTPAQLADATFCETYGITAYAVSGANGAFTFTNLVPTQTYYFKEVIGLENYVSDPNIYTLTVNAAGDGFTDGKTLTIINNPYGKIRILKTTELSGETFPVNGAVFSVYPAQLKQGAVGDATGNHAITDTSCKYEIVPGAEAVYTGTTGTETGFEGTMLSGLLRPGHYIVVETSAPTGFIKNDTRYHVVIEPGITNQYLFLNAVTNEADSGRFRLLKYKAGDETTILSATFSVETKVNGEWVPYYHQGASAQYTVTTAAGEVYLSDYLPAGDYRLTETSVQTGYTISGAQLEFTITAGEITGNTTPLKIANQPTGAIVADKEGWFNGEKVGSLSGFGFTLYKVVTDDAAQDCVPANIATAGGTNANGRLTLTEIDAGTYWLKETSVGNAAYSLTNAPVVKVTVAAGATTYLTGANAIRNTTVYGKLRITKVDMTDHSLTLTGAVFRVYDNAQCTGTVYDTITVNASGVGVSNALLDPAKSYWVKEVTIPSTYLAINGGIYGPFTVSANTVTDTTIENYKSQTVTITKINSVTREPVSGVQIAIYASEADAANDERLYAAKTTGADGTVSFSNLLPNTTYYFRELSAPNLYVYDKTTVYSVKTAPVGTGTLTIENVPKGRIHIKKVSDWLNAQDETYQISLDGVKFDIYAWNGNLAGGTRGDKVTSVTTISGSCYTAYLPAGFYEIVEVAPFLDGFEIKGTNSFLAEVKAGETNETYYNTPIENEPAKGRFRLIKYAAGSEATRLDGAQFLLMKYDATTQTYLAYPNVETAVFTVPNGEYTSQMLPEGQYKVKEISAPAGYTTNLNFEATFTILRGKTEEVKVENYAQGRIQLTKKDEETARLLAGAKFRLYTDGACQNPVLGQLEKTTGDTGLCTWYAVDAGTYYIKETAAAPGYALSDKIIKVIVPQQGTMPVVTLTVTNTANCGMLKITKVNQNGTLLEGAVFEIWTTGATPEKVETVSTNSEGIAYSGLLLADAAGTDYLVKEIQASAGYTLDSRLAVHEKTVTVIPGPTQAQATLVTFTNIQPPASISFHDTISKSIYPSTPAKSLLEEDLNVVFTLYDFTSGQNPLPLSDFTVTDKDIVMQYYEVVTGTEVAKDWTVTAADEGYTILRARVYKATDATGKSITATVQYQTLSEYGTDTWLTAGTTGALNLLASADDAETVNLPQTKKVMAIRVLYGTVGKEFTAGKIEMDVRFNKRAESSTRPEIRKIRNTGELSYTYDIYDRNGTAVEQKVDVETNEVFKVLPVMTENQAIVTLTNTANNANQIFSPGSSVVYNLVATNILESKNVFQSPIITVDLPAYTSLDSGFEIQFLDNNGTRIYPTVQSSTENVPAYDASGNAITQNGNPVTTTRIGWSFPGYQLARGEKITIVYRTIINNKPNSVTSLFSPAYLASSYKLPVTPENPYGLSFQNKSGGLVSNEGVNDFVDDNVTPEVNLGETEFVRDTETINVMNADSLVIYKQIKGPLDDHFLNAGEKSYTYPGGTFEYKITLVNNLSAAGKNVKIVDLLPVLGDTYTVRTPLGTLINRSTEIPRRPTLVSVTLPEGVEGTIYYSTKDWTKAGRGATGSTQAELPMLYSNGNNVWDGWTTTPPADLSTVTAIGIDFADKILATEGGELSVIVTMRNAEFTLDEIELFYNKITANSVAGSVTRVTDSTPEQSIEPNEVLSYMQLPWGAIGDYAFLDNNNNGIQDEGDTPITDLPVTLVQTEKKSDGTTTTTRYTAKTDENGYYLFDNLPTNFLLDQKNAGSTDPDDYIGNVYYSYYVEFGDPGNGVVPTFRYEGDDVAVDSNIGKDLRSETLTLSAYKNGSQLTGERNLTIDAGFTYPTKLGDRVWLDVDYDGIQGEDEPGVNGVTANLYRVPAQGDPVLYATTQTETKDGKAGMYLFEDLVPGDYMVEFDISGLKNSDGAYRYAFTTPNAGTADTDDSDAQTDAGESGRIKRTAKITLPVDPTYTGDMTWDAGIKAYSALGGYCFDDANYSDVQDIGIPLPGTKVELYRIGDDNLRGATPIAETVVGEDGKYFFDQLLPGTYQVYFEFPGAYQAVLPNVGTDDTLDSDVEAEIPETLKSGYTRYIELPVETVDTTWDAGARIFGAIGDYVWYDTNLNGIQDDGEVPAKDVLVTLQYQIGTDGTWETLSNQRTDENGRYLFEDLKCGPDSGYFYRVLFERPDGYRLTISNAGADDAVDSDALQIAVEGLGYPTEMIELLYGETDLTWDAGLTRGLGAVGDYVWYDDDRDGFQDPEELGVKGIAVELFVDADGNLETEDWASLGTTVTDETGKYLFTELPEGYYKVSFYIPEKYVVSPLTLVPTVSDSNLTDSDAFANGTSPSWCSTRAFYLEYEQTDLSWDAGIYKPGTILTGVISILPYVCAAGMVFAGGALLLMVFRKRRLTEKARHSR